MGIPEREKEKESEKEFETIMAKNLLHLQTNINLQT